MNKKLISLLLVLLPLIINAQKFQKITPSNPKIKYVGRFDFNNPEQPQFSFPGTSIFFSFKGSQVGFVFNHLQETDSAHTNAIEAIIDDTLHETFYLKSGVNKLHISTKLKDTTHHIQLFKRTESFVGTCEFGGILLKDTSFLQTYTLEKKYKIEVIGDSWSCAYGNMKATNPPKSGFCSNNENNWLSWGNILAQKINAWYVCTAYSGRGMSRNNTGNTEGILPVLYDQTIADNPQTVWNHQTYKPDLIFVYLGANDFYPETWSNPSMLDSANYCNVYINFIKKIHQLQPQSKIVILYGNSKSDWWPKGFRQLSRWRNYNKNIFNFLAPELKEKLFEYELKPQSPPYGEDWHPAVHTHEKIAEELKVLCEKILND